MTYGLQIFGCLKACKADPAAFFQRMAKAGYAQIEPCMVFGLRETPEEGSLLDAVWKPDEAAFYRTLLEESNLSLSSCHVFAENPLACVDEMRAAAQNYGITAYVLNCPKDVAHNWAAFADACIALEKALGMPLWLHNGYAEIAQREDGTTLYEKILDYCGGALGAQVDVGWALYGGEDPIALLRRIGQNLQSIHYKDIEKGYKNIPPDALKARLGDGCLDVRGIQAFCAPLGITQMVDQDKSYGDIVADQEHAIAMLRNREKTAGK